MKVLHVIPAVSPKYGGPSHALIPMCRALMAHGVDVQIASTDAEPNGRMMFEAERLDSYQGVPAIFFKKQWSEAFKYSSGLSRWLGRNVSSFDLVHIHGVFSHASLSAAHACQRVGVPYVVRPLGNLESGSLAQKPLRKKTFLKLGGNQMLRNAAVLHYVSQTEKQLSEVALPVNHGVVIPLGVDVGMQSSLKPSKNGFRTRRPYVLVLSRLLPAKGIDVLVEAFLAARERQQLRDWQLMIAGDGPADFLASLRRLIKEKNADDCIVFAGWLDGEAKERALAEASLVALPSLRDSFGFCVVEAISRGVPVLVSPHVGLAPEIERAGAGWISSVEVRSLRETLVSALSDNDDLRRRGDAGRALARKFDWDTVAEQLIRLYESVINGKANERQIR